MKARKITPEIIVKDGKPRAVILDIGDYEEILERLEDSHDLQMLRAMRKKALRFRKLQDVLNELSSL